MSRGVGAPLLVGKTLDYPLNSLPPESSETEFPPPQEAFVIYVATNCQGQWTAILWGEKSSSKLKRVLYDIKNCFKWSEIFKKFISRFTLNQHCFQYHSLLLLWVPPCLIQKILILPLKFPPLSKRSIPPCLWKFQNFFTTSIYL